MPGARVARVPARRVVVAEGTLPWAVGVVESGFLTVSVTTEAGRRAVIALLGPGHVFGAATFTGPASFLPEVRALVPSRLLLLPALRPPRASKLDLTGRWGETDPAICLLGLVARQAAETECRLARWLTLPADERVLDLLQDLAGSHGSPVSDGSMIGVPLTQDLLAGLTGMTRESVNRALARLRSRGLVRRSGRRYVVSSSTSCGS